MGTIGVLERALLSTAVILAVVGCGSNSGNFASTSATQGTDVTSLAVPVIPNSVVPSTQQGTWEPSATFQLTGVTPDGSTADIVVEFGLPARFGEVESLPDLASQALVDCGGDAERDVAIPGRVTVTSTTAGFSSSFGVGLFVYGTGIEDMPGLLTSQGELRAEAVVGDGSAYQCNAIAASGVRAIVSHFTLAPGEQASRSFYVTLYDYFSPSEPTGDRRMLNSLFFRGAAGGPDDLELNANSTGGDGVSITEATGDGILVDVNFHKNWLMSPLGTGVVTLLLPTGSWVRA